MAMIMFAPLIENPSTPLRRPMLRKGVAILKLLQCAPDYMGLLQNVSTHARTAGGFHSFRNGSLLRPCSSGSRSRTKRARYAIQFIAGGFMDHEMPLSMGLTHESG